MSMVTILSCNTEHGKIKSTFSHPVKSQEINVFLHPCHMLKIVRNSFALMDKVIILDGILLTINTSYR